MRNEKLQLLAHLGYSIIPCKEDKRPLGAWKEYQTKARTMEEVSKLKPALYGIVTGHNYLTCVDIDLKVFSTAKEQREWWDGYLSFLEDNILDFYDKFVIKKTKNNGYHILFKSKRLTTNQKIAKLKGHTEAIIETRGEGGMVIAYDDGIGKLDYQDIQYISDEDRDILFYICDSFDFKIKAEKIEIPKKQEKEYLEKEGDITPWEDFDSKNDVWDIVSNDFVIVRNLKDRIVIKRHGATSTHSGYIFRDNGCMFLHSTGSIYLHERQISPYAAYTYKNHNGDFSASAKELYQKGYGSRKEIKLPVFEKDEIEKQKERVNNNMDFPIDVFPTEFQKYMLESAETLNSSIDYMGCSLLWVISVIVGNSAKIKIKEDWDERPVLWFALVGKAGIGKTHSINRIIRPLQKENGRAIRRYVKEFKKFEYFDSLSKKEKEQVDPVKEPKKEQFIVGDATIEALVQLHQDSANSVGIYRDELAGWIMDMNKYRAGSDLQTWLGTWSGEQIIANRVKESSNAYVAQPFLPILGGIQPSILNVFYTDDNKASGFTDRILLSYPDVEVQPYNKNQIDPMLVENYENKIINFYRYVKERVTQNEDGDVDFKVFTWSEEGEEEWERLMHKIYLMEVGDHTNEYIKSILAKIKSYLARFSLLLHIFKIAMGEESSKNGISANTVKDAEKLGDYFIFMAEKIKVTATESYSMKNVVKNEKLNNAQKVKEIMKNDKDFNKTELAELMGVSRQMIYKYIKEIKAK